MTRVPYANAMKSLMYVMMCTKLDLAQVITLTNRYIVNPRKEHCQVVKHTHVH